MCNVIMESPHRARFAAVPAAVLLAAGAGLGVGGWFVANAATYVCGLVLAVLGGWLLLFVALPMLRQLVRAGLCVLLAVAVLGLGLSVPRQMLAAEFDGEGVLWSVPSDDELIEVVLGDIAVLANATSARMISLLDGRELGRLPADYDARFTLAGDRLLVVDHSSAMLYDRSARPVWPAPVHAERGVAADGDVTVVEAQDVASAIADDGSIRWTREVDSIRAAHSRFPAVLRLPEDNIFLDKGPPVLPPLAALPLAGTAWEFVDATGATVARADGEYAGAVGDTPITSTLVGDWCDLWIAGQRKQLDCTFGKPWAMGHLLFFENGIDAIALPADGGTGTTLESVALGTYHKDRRLMVSDEGMAYREGSLIRGYPALSYRDHWEFVAESEGTTAYVGNGTVAVLTWVRRTNPLDHSTGRDDHRVTVHDGRTGTVTGSIRADGPFNSVEPLPGGAALLSADGKVTLVGRSMP